ncbi:unnamed protein product [Leuciscus chuanchicus]
MAPVFGPYLSEPSGAFIWFQSVTGHGSRTVRPRPSLLHLFGTLIGSFQPGKPGSSLRVSMSCEPIRWIVPWLCRGVPPVCAQVCAHLQSIAPSKHVQTECTAKTD